MNDHDGLLFVIKFFGSIYLAYVILKIKEKVDNKKKEKMFEHLKHLPKPNKLTKED